MRHELTWTQAMPDFLLGVGVPVRERESGERVGVVIDSAHGKVVLADGVSWHRGALCVDLTHPMGRAYVSMLTDGAVGMKISPKVRSLEIAIALTKQLLDYEKAEYPNDTPRIRAVAWQRFARG